MNQRFYSCSCKAPVPNPAPAPSAQSFPLHSGRTWSGLWLSEWTAAHRVGTTSAANLEFLVKKASSPGAACASSSSFNSKIEAAADTLQTCRKPVGAPRLLVLWDYAQGLALVPLPWPVWPTRRMGKPGLTGDDGSTTQRGIAQWQELRCPREKVPNAPGRPGRC